jgi:hypothetical protein
LTKKRTVNETGFGEYEFAKEEETLEGREETIEVRNNELPFF